MTGHTYYLHYGMEAEHAEETLHKDGKNVQMPAMRNDRLKAQRLNSSVMAAPVGPPISTGHGFNTANRGLSVRTHCVWSVLL